MAERRVGQGPTFGSGEMESHGRLKSAVVRVLGERWRE